MSNPVLSTPVALLIFRRPQQTARVFEAIRAARPRQLLIVADGVRHWRGDDPAAVAQTRAIVEKVDWECQVLHNYADANMGCKPRVASGLDWVFQQTERAIILEDDCLPHPSFFPFCQELLERYADDSHIGWISGTDLQLGRQITSDSYHFARNAHIWGWASWRRSWQAYDGDMKQWPALRDSGWLAKLYEDSKQVEFWTAFFDQAHRGETAWDVPWLFSNWAKDRFNVVPNTNLVSNIGFDAQATGDIAAIDPIFHELFANTAGRQMPFPLKHPTTVVPNSEADSFSFRGVGLFDADYLRSATLKSWGKADPNEFAGRLKTDWTQAALKVIGSGLRRVPSISTEDRRFAESLVSMMGDSVSTTDSEPTSLQNLLAAMLYLRADQIDGLSLDLEKLPEWFQPEFINYLLDAPPIFTDDNESERYAAFLERLMDTIWDHICTDPVADVWSNAAVQFLNKGAFIGVYFSKQNLRKLYEKRGQLLEGILRGLGHKIDYEFPSRPNDRPKIRIGIVAAHYAPQTETYTTLPAYKHLSRDRYEIILFTANQSAHRMERFCAGHADTLVSLAGEIPEQVANIRKWDCDVVWIGTNVTAVTNAVTVLAVHRLGRVQVTSTSSCATTGMRNIDYYISGSMCEPRDAQQQYTEKLLLMDGPAHCMDFGTEAKPLATQKPTRAELEIHADDVVFASGANFYKVIPEVQAVWIKILVAVPKSRLMLYPFNVNWAQNYPVQIFMERFKRAMKEAGVSEDRLRILAPAPNRGDVLNRLRLADIYLDSFPFSGVNSLLDPLEVGLPPVVMEGNSFRSLMASSLMRELQVPELIAADESAYVAQAIKLANEPSLRADYAKRIKDGMANRPRFINSEWYSGEVDRLLTSILAERGINAGL